MDKIEVRDMRNGNWLWIHKFIYDSQVLSVYHKAMYQGLCYFANNEDQKCYPSLESIAKVANVSYATANKYIHELQEFGLIEIISGGKGAKNTNKYLLKRITKEGMKALEERWRINKMKNIVSRAVDKS